MSVAKLISIFFALAIGLSPAAVVRADPAESQNKAEQAFHVDAKSALIMEPATGQIILSQNAHEKLPPASVTKVMTLLLIYEAIRDGKIKWDDTVTVSQHAASMGGSQVFLSDGEKQSVKELVKSIVIASGNDAAVAMAEFIGGSEEAFVGLMNKRAQELGMNDTHFVNACGLDADGHVTSAYDIALMSRELVNNFPEVFDISTIWMDKIIHQTPKGEQETGLTNTNKLIKQYHGATGLKTGSTSQALFCIAATAKRDNMNLIAVIMAAPTPDIRILDAKQMFDYGFANFTLAQGEPAGTVMGKVNVVKGQATEVPYTVKKQINCLVGKGGKDKLTYEAHVLDDLHAPVLKDSKIGEIVYFYNGKEVGKTDAVTTAEVKRAGFWLTFHRVIEGGIGVGAAGAGEKDKAGGSEGH